MSSLRNTFRNLSRPFLLGGRLEGNITQLLNMNRGGSNPSWGNIDLGDQSDPPSLWTGGNSSRPFWLGGQPEKNTSQFLINVSNLSTVDLSGVTWMTYVLIVPLSILLALIDVWIIASIGLNRKLRSYSNYLLVNLLVSELLFVLLISFDTQLLFNEDGSLSCGNSVFVLLITTSLYSSYFLCAVCVAVDKYIKISRPLKYGMIMTRRVCVAFIVTAWTLALTTSILTSVLFKVSEDCQELIMFFLHLQETVVIYTNIVALPMLAIIVGLNISIIRIARHQARAIADLTPRPTSEANYPNNDQQQQPAADDKSSRFFRAFLWSFVLVWLPPIIINDIAFFTPNTLSSAMWFVALRNLVSVLGLCQMLYGTVVLTVKQQQFRAVLTNNLQSLKQKLKGFKD